MKHLIIFAFSCCFIVQVSFAQQSKKEVMFNENVSDTERTWTNVLKAFLVIDTVQKLSDKGIRFSIKLKSNCDTGISIINPLFLLYLVITNESGKNIWNMVVSTGRKHRDTLFKVEKVIVNGHPSLIDLTPASFDLTDARYIAIPPRGLFEIFLAVDSTTGSTKNSRKADYRQPVPEGNYSFSAMFRVQLKGEAKNYLLSTAPINIVYKKQDTILLSK